VLVFSGSLVPLPLFPEWTQAFLSILPFRGLVDTPFRLYLGHIPPGDVLFHLAHQLAWAASIVVVGRWVLSRGVRRLVVQGG
jgi:ABC-2 type transport system permease protein